MRPRRFRGFSLAEAILAIFLIGLTMGMVGALFQRSFVILRMLDDKERARQASRMGLDRITSELREATEILQTGTDLLIFEKIDPTARLENPPSTLPPAPPLPDDLQDTYVPPAWTPLNAYPPASRLEVRYEIEGENLIRAVRLRSGGTQNRQVVVVGVNSFVCEVNPENPSEVDVTLAVRDNRKISTLSSRIMAPCIVVEFGE